MHRISLLIKQMGFLVICLLSTSLHAVTPADFAKDYEYLEAKISPDGKHIGLIIIHEGKRRLAVLDSKTFESVGGANFGDRQQVGSFFWVSDERLVISIAHYFPWHNEALDAGELFAVDYNGKRGKIIYGVRAGQKQVGSNIKKKEAVKGWAEIVNLLPDDEDNILISSEPYSLERNRVPTVHKLNVNSGRMSGIKATGPINIARFFADRKGEVKIATGLDIDANRKVFKLVGGEWNALDTSEFGSDFQPLAMDAANENLYVIDSAKQDKDGIFKLNLKTGTRVAVYTHETVDILDAEFGSDTESVYAALIEADYPTYQVFDTETEESALFAQLTQTFKGYRISIRGSDEDKNLWIIHASNDTTAGTYYLFNKKTGQFSILFQNMAHIPAASMSQSIPVSFKASDGMNIHAYITYPVSVPETQNVPLVTLVHGGPHGVRDYWEFDREVQLLTSQGYAVLRVNYRGSGGYGADFEVAGYKEWGARIQQDIIEGTKWIISQGGIDQTKVCIMGASFGGYSAVQSAILAPDLFKCAVATVGVYNLPDLLEEGNVANRLYYGPNYLKAVMGSEQEKLKTHSPVYNLDKLQTPVLISHGTKDEQAPFEQAVELKDKLESMGKPHVWNPVNAETHGFYNEANRAAYYEKVAGFLAEHLK